MSSLSSDSRGVLVRCSSCGTTNRLRYATIDREIRCGRCRTGLPAPASPIESADAASFDALITESPVPVVVDFWAPWCAPCRMMAPELETVARDMQGDALVVKVNTDEVSALGERFRIRSIPTLAVFRGGREVTRAAGVRPAAEIQALLARA
jgi:thioredoxin 2